MPFASPSHPATEQNGTTIRLVNLPVPEFVPSLSCQMTVFMIIKIHPEEGAIERKRRKEKGVCFAPVSAPGCETNAGVAIKSHTMKSFSYPISSCFAKIRR